MSVKNFLPLIWNSIQWSIEVGVDATNLSWKMVPPLPGRQAADPRLSSPLRAGWRSDGQVTSGLGGQRGSGRPGCCLVHSPPLPPTPPLPQPRKLFLTSFDHLPRGVSVCLSASGSSHRRAERTNRERPLRESSLPGQLPTLFAAQGGGTASCTARKSFQPLFHVKIYPPNPCF